MRIIHWNIKHNSNKDKVIATLARLASGGDTIICLQEVTPAAKETIISGLNSHGFAQNGNYAYSLDYRHPSKYDGLNRQLGVLVLCSDPMYILNCNALHRTPFPDRTVCAEILRNGEIIKVLSLHSITGCAYSKAKSTQYFSFAEAVDAHRPDIITIDANEPKVDHYDVNQMVFYDNKDKGAGAKTFFTTMDHHQLCDAYVLGHNEPWDELKPELPHSIKVNRKGLRRYDFMFVSNRLFVVDECRYLYQEGLEGGSDHALIVCDATVQGPLPDRQQSLRENSFYPYDPLRERQLLQFCRYYGHPEKEDATDFASLESRWVEYVLNGKGNPLDHVSERELNILQTFYPEDGVPLGLKALLFNRYCHWSSYSTFDSFKAWYLSTYIAKGITG